MATFQYFGLDFYHVPLLCDSSSAISVAKNHVLHSKTKDIDVRFHFLCEHSEKGDIDLRHVDTHRQVADIFTKPFINLLLHICEGKLLFSSLFDRGRPFCFFFLLLLFHVDFSLSLLILELYLHLI
jgi:hypothetical protein